MNNDKEMLNKEPGVNNGVNNELNNELNNEVNKDKSEPKKLTYKISDDVEVFAYEKNPRDMYSFGQSMYVDKEEYWKLMGELKFQK